MSDDPAHRAPDEPEPPSPDEAGARVARLHPPGLPHHAALDRAVQGMIGTQLRRMYEHLVDQPLPDRLLALVGRIAANAPPPVTDDEDMADRIASDAPPPIGEDGDPADRIAANAPPAGDDEKAAGRIPAGTVPPAADRSVPVADGDPQPAGAGLWPADPAQPAEDAPPRRPKPAEPSEHAPPRPPEGETR